MSIFNNNALKRCWETQRLFHERVNFKQVIPNIEIYFLFQSDLWYLLTVGVEGGCCTWSHWMTHTHTHLHTHAHIHTHKHTHIKGGIPLDEGTARGRDLYLSMYNTHKTQISMPPARFEPATPASERPQTHAFDSAATGICSSILYRQNIFDILYGAFSIVWVCCKCGKILRLQKSQTITFSPYSRSSLLSPSCLLPNSSNNSFLIIIPKRQN